MSTLNKSVIIECVASTDDKDITGERLDIAGADISPLLESRGFMNSDHRNDFAHTVGKVIAAKKIMKVEDCETPFQMQAWGDLKKPFIWAKGELYDGVGHKEADAIASVYRHYMEKGEKPPVAISVEGKTLERGPNGALKRTLIKGIALTLRPCNRATRSEVVALTKSAGCSEDLVKSESDVIPSFYETTDGSLDKLYQLAVSARELLRGARVSLTKAETKEGYELKSPNLLRRLKELTGTFKKSS